ncbi:LysE family translocator [Shewanella woodyi]|uniref:Lysine exporter protein (LYSE/YGGA) n=1 Tax=Shewanella woodyi (strain ATCC 51908 / MS32) TaxID=392500 RepID=B1KFL7_SHEWM|nr:LysE family translocator [Shewanella woodyi]ACA88192.1 Lysine exporter protein (LYSE/YGGA) [Shewanella woodyi ATCC 51908]
MSISIFMTLFMVSLLGAMSPGQSVIMVARNTLAGGRAQGIITACAHSIGVGLYAGLSLAGLALVLKNSPLFYNTITYLGAAYLAWLGICSLRSKGGITDKLNSGKQMSLYQAARSGFVISILNPKIIIFYLALFSQFVENADSMVNRIIIVTTPTVLDAVWYIFIACMLSKPTTLIRLRQHAQTIDKVSGMLLLLLAGRILIS